MYKEVVLTPKVWLYYIYHNSETKPSNFIGNLQVTFINFLKMYLWSNILIKCIVYGYSTKINNYLLNKRSHQDILHIGRLSLTRVEQLVCDMIMVVVVLLTSAHMHDWHWIELRRRWSEVNIFVHEILCIVIEIAL